MKIRRVDEEVSAKRLKIEGVRNESEARPGKEVMIPGRDTSAGSSGRELFLANSPRGPMPGNRLENMAIEMDDDNNVDDDDDDESRSSGQPFLTERSDPWPTTQRSDAPGSPSVTPRSEVLTFRSDTDSYSADFTDVHNKTDVSGDDEIDRDHLESHSTAVPGFDDSRRTSSHHRGLRERLFSVFLVIVFSIL